MSSRFQRLAETDRARITLHIDGDPVDALQGDTLLVAMLTHGTRVRVSEFGDGARAGFCLMGACQDCWVWTEDGAQLRACLAPATQGMRVRTAPPEATWPNLA